MNKSTIAQILTYAGLIPFIATLLIPVFWPSSITPDFTHFFVTYGAIIVSFIAGIHWGVYLFKDAPVNLFVHSNVAALLAWFSLLIAMPYSTYVLLFCFLYLLMIDRTLFKSKILEAWYMKLRLNVTLIVILALSFKILF